MTSASSSGAESMAVATVRPDSGGSQSAQSIRSGGTDPSSIAASETSITAFERREHQSGTRSPHAQQWREVRRVCEEMIVELQGILSINEKEESLDVLASDRIVEFEHLVQELKQTDLERKTCIPRICAIVNGQVRNARWSQPLAAMLVDLVSRVKTSYRVDDDVVKECMDIVESAGFDPLRGTLSATNIKKRYRVVAEDA